MPGQPIRTAAGASSARVNSWRLLLVILFVLLPVTMALAAPEPPSFSSGDPIQHEAGAHQLNPSDTPACRHVGHHRKAPVLIGENRTADFSASADSGPAVPSHGPVCQRLTIAEYPRPTTSSYDSRLAFPIYLRTHRLRV
ncbi:hypothetical protein J2T57_004178 [Natronocella acetinitrilica]|uniref:Uncharacterized protein n=1 Tax=Natronocella acetinitrilica TaxID=414046 RepID=A0AAE3G7B7_9GAMM|nr:hypothetical protein [Natronocella acetinitrilica]